MPAASMQFPFQRDSFDAQRVRMVRVQVAERSVRDRRVLGAMLEVPRHECVPESLLDQAYEDHPLPIGAGQTISQPYIVAGMFGDLAPHPTDSTLEISTGSGYVTSLPSRTSAARYSVEWPAAPAGESSPT